jgi:flagellar basal-body rod modification protein FlgD
MTTAVNSYDALGLSLPTQSTTKKELGQADFLKLMTTQLQSQDPFKPMDSSQFLGQIAQFSQVSGIQSLNTSFGTLTASLTGNQTLQGAALIGRQVLVNSSALTLPASGTAAAVATLPASGDVRLQVRDASGALVRQVDYGTQAQGRFTMQWDGLDAQGQRAAAGQYQISAQLMGVSGDPQALTTQVASTVTAVSNSSQGLQLDVAGAGTVALANVSTIQ